MPTGADEDLDLSVREVVAFGAMLGLGEMYVGWYALSRGAPAWLLGVLPTLAQFLGALAQVPSANLLDRVRRRAPIYVGGSVVQMLTWVAIGATLLLPRGPALAVLTVSFALYFAGVNYCAPAWTSMMGDLVPADRRGRYFARRTRAFLVSQLLAALAAGAVLRAAPSLGGERVAYGILFAGALVARAVSVRLLIRMREPAYEPRPEAGFSFLDFLRALPRANYARFTLYAAAYAFAVNLVVPFHALYMRRDLGFSDTQYAMALAAVVAGNVAALYAWGPLCDRFGNRRVVSFCGFWFSVGPLLWVLGRSPAYVAFLQFTAGATWSGYALGLGNFILDAVTPARRARCFAYFSVLSGAGVLAGGAVGAILVDRLPGEILGVRFFSPLYALMLLSFAARMAVQFGMMPMFREVRPVPDVSALGLLLQATHLRPVWNLAAHVLSPRKGDRGGGDGG